MLDYRRDTRMYRPFRVTIEATVFMEDYGDGTLSPADWGTDELLARFEDAPDVDIVSCVELVDRVVAG